jgi:hypothetical protein
LSRYIRDQYIKGIATTENALRRLSQTLPQGRHCGGFCEYAIKSAGIRMGEQDTQEAIPQPWFLIEDFAVQSGRHLDRQAHDNQRPHVPVADNRHNKLVVEPDEFRAFTGLFDPWRITGSVIVVAGMVIATMVVIIRVFIASAFIGVVVMAFLCMLFRGGRRVPPAKNQPGPDPSTNADQQKQNRQ